MLNVAYSGLAKFPYHANSVEAILISRKLGYYSKVADIDDFLEICNEYNIVPFITLREEFANNYIYDGTNTQYFGVSENEKIGEYLLHKIFLKLSKYNLQDIVYFNCFVHDFKKYIKNTSEPWISDYDVNSPSISTQAIVSSIRTINTSCAVVWTQNMNYANQAKIKERADYLHDLPGKNILNLFLSNDATKLAAIQPMVDYCNEIGVPVFNSIINNYPTYRKMLKTGYSGVQIERHFLNYDVDIYDFTIVKKSSGWLLCDTFFYGEANGQSYYNARIQEDSSDSKIIYIDNITLNTESGDVRNFADAILVNWFICMPCRAYSYSDNATTSIERANKRIKVTFENVPSENTQYRIVLEI